MTRVGNWRLLTLAVAGLVAGGLLGGLARRQGDRGPLVPRPQRAPLVDAALRAWSAGDVARAGELLASLAPGAVAGNGDRADVAFLAAALDADDDAMAAVIARWPETDAAGRAAWWRVLHAPDDAERQRRRAVFAERWPGAWVLRDPDADPR